MSDEHDRLPALEPDALQLEFYLLARHRIERAERLVHQQHGGIVDEGSHHRDALSMPPEDSQG